MRLFRLAGIALIYYFVPRKGHKERANVQCYLLERVNVGSRG